MDLLTIWLPVLIPTLVTLIMVLIEPRRMSCAIWLGISLQLLIGLFLTWLSGWSFTVSEEASVITLLAIAGVALLSVLVLAVLLIQSGVVLLRREGISLSHSLALLLGCAILLYLVGAVVALMFSQVELAVLLLLLGMPIYYLSFVLVSYLVYAALYGFWANRWSPPASIVVVLGAGLMGDQITPLLRARLDVGIKTYERSLARGLEPLLVVSGGQGAGESVAEATAMARYLHSQGVDRSTLVEESRSTTTEENLHFTRAVLGNRSNIGKWMAVSSDYHAFRAALLMRRMQIKGNAIGAPTPRYFWAAAILREYVAILREHWKLNLTLVLLSAVPFFMMIFAWTYGSANS